MQLTMTKILIDSENVADHPLLDYWYDINGGLEVYVTLSGRPVKDHYGVPGSPVWWTIEDVRIQSIEINGVTYTSKQFDEIATEQASAYIDELIEDLEYEFADWE